MPSPQPSGSIKRPPIIPNGSSLSSLGGRGQAVPSFQAFVKQTSPIGPKAVSPPPGRASSSSPVRPRAPSTHTRRSSSVYSRSTSQFGSEASSWRSADFADEPLPPLPTLLPVAYSASTPQLVERQLTPPLLEPRTYRPLIRTPSPTASRVSTPSPPQHKPSILLPLPPVQVKVPRKHLRSVSLATAKAEVHSPAAVHLLPEELRAEMIAKVSRCDPTAHSKIKIPRTDQNGLYGYTSRHSSAAISTTDNAGRPSRTTLYPALSNRTICAGISIPKCQHEERIPD